MRCNSGWIFGLVTFFILLSVDGVEALPDAGWRCGPRTVDLDDVALGLITPGSRRGWNREVANLLN